MTLLGWSTGRHSTGQGNKEIEVRVGRELVGDQEELEY